MTPFFSNINHKTLPGRFIISMACSAVGFIVLILLIGLRFGDTEKVIEYHLPYLLVLHFPFWMLLVFAVNEVLRRRFGKIAGKFAGRLVTMALLLLLTACLFIPADESLIFSVMEIFCGLLSLNLTAKSKTESYGRHP